MIGSARPRWDAARETLSLAQVSQCCSCDVYAGAKSPLGLRFRRFVLRVVRASPPHAHRDRSPDRLCIPSRAASHRLNVKVGKNVYNHEGPRKKGPVGVSDGAEPERWREDRGGAARRGGRGSPDRTDEQARSTPGTTATGWGREKRARRPKGEMETPRSGHPLVRPLVRAAFGCLARDRAGPLRLRALL